MGFEIREYTFKLKVNIGISDRIDYIPTQEELDKAFEVYRDYLKLNLEKAVTGSDQGHMNHVDYTIEVFEGEKRQG